MAHSDDVLRCRRNQPLDFHLSQRWHSPMEIPGNQKVEGQMRIHTAAEEVPSMSLDLPRVYVISAPACPS
jgi:hypothetical protein